ncbi:TPA: hypothetical protein ACLGO4_004738 [Salmonella enterica]
MSNFSEAFPWFFLLFVIASFAVFAKNASKKKLKTHSYNRDINEASSGVILKFELTPAEKSILLLPEKAMIISVKGGEDIINIWAIVPEGQENIRRTFLAIPTGENAPGKGIFIDSAYVGKLVFHIFEAK